MRYRVLLAGAIVCSLAVTPGVASSSQAWVLRNRSDFTDVDLSGVALSADGTFRLSADVTSLFDAAQPNLWCLTRDAKGRIIVGGGNEGKVYRLESAGGKSEVIFDGDELGVHALALDSKGRLYVATSPRGAIYRVEESGARILVFDPEEVYIWALVFDDRDRLYVATGQKGRVFRVDAPGPNASAKVVLDGREDHIRSLAKGPDGVLYAGSDQSGILYRIAADGASSVVYDSPMREIAAISFIDDQIYLAALAPVPRPRGSSSGSGGAVQGGVTRIRVTADEGGGGEPEQPQQGSDEEQEQQRRQQPARPPATTEPFTGAVYRVDRHGYARKLWESREALPLSLAPFGDGRVLVGTGDDGRVLLLDDTGSVTDFVAVEAQQVNALIRADGQGFLAAASNLGQVFRINPGSAREGTVVSKAYDAGFTSAWGAVSWSGQTPAGASITMQVRTGNTEVPDDSWSPWSGEYRDASGSVIDRPKARFLQWKATLRSKGDGVPVLGNIQINYLQDNLPPEVTSVEILPPGSILASTGAGGMGGESGESANGRRGGGPARRGFEKGRRSVQWKAEDGNNDELRYEVFFKAEDETLWKSLAQDLEDDFHTWDATAMPDGVYRVQVTASDAPSNPPGAALSGTHVSAAFDVDNTPPVVGSIEAQMRSRSVEVSVTISDTFSAIGDVAYSLDAGDWITVLPDDRIADAMKEAFLFSTGELAAGEHTITVRARDRAGNTAANKIVIRVK